VLTFSVADNLVLNTYYHAPFTKGMTLQLGEIERAAEEGVEQFDVRTPGISVPVANLSGGNQQKVIVARVLRPIKLLIAAQPTRPGCGSVEYIHSRIIQKATKAAPYAALHRAGEIMSRPTAR
jgi:simple sugar transport system ATP-binding protein